jgi:hypothetical protein
METFIEKISMGIYIYVCVCFFFIYESLIHCIVDVIRMPTAHVGREIQYLVEISIKKKKRVDRTKKTVFAVRFSFIIFFHI